MTDLQAENELLAKLNARLEADGLAKCDSLRINNPANVLTTDKWYTIGYRPYGKEPCVASLKTNREEFVIEAAIGIAKAICEAALTPSPSVVTVPFKDVPVGALFESCGSRYRKVCVPGENPHRFLDVKTWNVLAYGEAPCTLLPESEGEAMEELRSMLKAAGEHGVERAKEVYQLRRQLAERERTIHWHEENCERLKRTMNAKYDDTQDLTTQVCRRLNELNDALPTMTHLQDLCRQEKELSAKDAEIATLKEQLAEREKELKESQDATIEAVESCKPHAEGEQRIVELLSAKDAEIERLREDNKKLRGENGEVTFGTQLSEANEMIGTFTARLNMQREKLTKLRAERDGLTAQVATLRGALERVKNSMALTFPVSCLALIDECNAALSSSPPVKVVEGWVTEEHLKAFEDDKRIVLYHPTEVAEKSQAVPATLIVRGEQL